MTGLPKSVIIQDEVMEVRPATKDDHDFIFATWLPAARDLTHARKNVFNAFFPGLVTDLLETEPAVVLTKRGGNALHAWACGKPPNVLHFAYVPYALRGNGLGRAVIEGVLGGYPNTIYVTTSPLSWSRHSRLHYNPYLLMRAA